jgi:hypothetical protein
VNSAGFITGSGTANWNGIAGYVTQQLGSKFSGTIRLETFDDAGGYRTGFDQQWNEGTVTLAYAPSSQFLFRGELRSDSSNHPVFTNPDGTGRSNLESAGLEAIVRF